MFSADEAIEVLKFWALGPEPAGSGYPSVNLTMSLMSASTDANDIAIQSKAMYDQFGITTLNVAQDLIINELDTARLTIQMSAETYVVQQYQYIFVHGLEAWVLTLAVDVNEWLNYEPLFIAIAQSFVR